VTTTEIVSPAGGLRATAARPRSATATTGPARWAWEATYMRRLVAVDLLVGTVAALAALQLRFGPLPSRMYLLVTVAFPFAWLAALALAHAYDRRFLFAGSDEYQRVFRAGLGLTAGLALVSYSFNTPLARGYVVIAIPVAVAAGLVSRYLQRRHLHNSWGRGERLRRVLIVGRAAAVEHMTSQLRQERFHGLGVVGVCARPGESYSGDLPVVGGTDDVAAAVRAAGADTVLVLSTLHIDGAALRRMAWQLENDDIDMIVASSLVDVADRTTIRPVDGLPMLHVEHPRLRGATRVAKEVFDRVAATAGLIMIAPVLLTIAALIRFGDRGPAMFRQVRVGKDGREFEIYKFRTMYTDAEARLADVAHLNEGDGALFKMRDDPRVTPVGKWLRRFSLDELPQLINVVLGDMSLVGPRPPLPSEVAQYPADMRRRLVVKPGMTGLWQVSGRADLSWEESIRLDLRYVENWSLTMDLVILARTVTAVLRLSGAY